MHLEIKGQDFLINLSKIIPILKYHPYRQLHAHKINKPSLTYLKTNYVSQFACALLMYSCFGGSLVKRGRHFLNFLFSIYICI